MSTGPISSKFVTLIHDLQMSYVLDILVPYRLDLLVRYMLDLLVPYMLDLPSSSVSVLSLLPSCPSPVIAAPTNKKQRHHVTWVPER